MRAIWIIIALWVSIASLTDKRLRILCRYSRNAFLERNEEIFENFNCKSIFR